MEDITKLCADSLRAFTQNNYGINLKSSHAHELVAAFFGYKSKAALLADKQYSPNNIWRAESIILNLDPFNSAFVDQRLKDFRYEYLNAYNILDCFRTTIKEVFQAKVYSNFHELATQIAQQRLHEKLKMWRIDPAHSMEWNINETMQSKDNGDTMLTVEVTYNASTNTRLKYSTYLIYLPRISANLGFGKPKVEEVYYAGEMRKETVSGLASGLFYPHRG